MATKVQTIERTWHKMHLIYNRSVWLYQLIMLSTDYPLFVRQEKQHKSFKQKLLTIWLDPQHRLVVLLAWWITSPSSDYTVGTIATSATKATITNIATSATEATIAKITTKATIATIG